MPAKRAEGVNLGRVPAGREEYNSDMPPKRANPKGYERARQLRKNLTPAEEKLWARLRGNKLDGASFRRQHAIGNTSPISYRSKGN